jgi:hypothetical protein
MTCKTPLFLYLPAMLLMTTEPLGGLSTTLTHTTVIHLRLDYLLHALMLAPLAPLRRLGLSPAFPPADHPGGPLPGRWPEGIIQYLLPYRAWNVNDAIGNGVGVLFSPLLLGIRRPTMMED